ncbi:MAG: penicillin-binding protein 1C [Acidithiobacillus caldus]|nr:penicillin-binding protein 1C [Acidithiobacillus caldus]
MTERHGHGRWWVMLFLVAALLCGGYVLRHDPLRGTSDLRDWRAQSTLLTDRHGRWLRLTLAQDEQYRLWTPLERIDPRLREAILMKEDRYFYYEPGFNPWSLLRGAYRTYLRHRHPQGGSTITMQLARLLWNIDTRDPRGKLRQIAYALDLELHFSKAQILEAYLNYAPFGRNIQGVGAASRIYFGHGVEGLSLPELLTLAVLPQDPGQRGRIDRDGNAALLAARQRLYAKWREHHPVTAAEDAALRLPMALSSVAQLPYHAPWFVDQVLQEERTRALLRQGGLPSELHTSLDLAMQRIVEGQLHAFVQEQQIKGIRNAAALLVDTRDMGIRALVGSANFFDAAIAGQVNGTLGKRSPGSTLKPFIYALAFDQGVVIPATVLRDVPTAFGPYTPENFDSRFEGPITVTDALIRSRNIPAVDVAARLHHPSFYDFLRAAGITGLAPESHYGLALVLGGGEVTMQELATLYALLNNDGRLRPLSLLAKNGTDQSAGPRLLSPEASYLVLDILRQNPGPLVAPTGQARDLPVAWKTGTSSGFRDAWSVAVFDHYVLVVWVGNFDGTANPALIGAEVAAPLLFRTIYALRASGVGLERAATPMPPPRLRRVDVCLSSGALPTVWCPRRGKSWFIPGVSPIAVDSVYRPIWVDRRSGRAVCPPYDPRRHELRVYAYWPSELRQVFAQSGIPRARPPAPAVCGSAGAAVEGSAPQIRSPLRGLTYLLGPTGGEQTPLHLSADADGDVARLYWFAGSTYLGQSASGQSLEWRPERPGTYRLRVVDDRGRADSRTVQVALRP